jgi:hypothetical protein
MVSQRARQEMIAPTPMEVEKATMELRFVTSPRGTRAAKVLQQKFMIHDTRSSKLEPREEWRDVPLVTDHGD